MRTRFFEPASTFLSAYFERHRDAYYDHLLSVSQRGTWMEWIAFFLRGVAEEGRDGVGRARRLLELRDRYRHIIETSKMPAAALSVVDSFFATPIISLPTLTKNVGMSYNTAQSVIKKLEAQNIVSEITGQQRNRVYLASEILDVLQLPSIAPADVASAIDAGQTQS